MTPADPDWGSLPDGRSALDALAPRAARALRLLETAAWNEADAGLADLAARVCALQLAITPMAPPPGIAPAPVGAPADTWRTDASPSDAQRAAAAFAEQFTLDVSAMDDARRGALVAHLGEATRPFLQVLYVVDIVPRARLFLDRLFGASPASVAPAEIVPYAEAFEAMLRDIAKLDALDPVTTELVRLRGARQHQCRICKSRRSRTAILAGADESTFDAVDDYETSSLPDRTKTALRFTDAFIWQPGYLAESLLAEVRAAFTPREAVELVLDVTRNAANKVAVAFGADAAVVSEGVELYEIDERGDVVAGMSL